MPACISPTMPAWSISPMWRANAITSRGSRARVPTSIPPMSQFLHCLNTSTIRPAPLLEKIRIGGALGFRAIEAWNDEIPEFLGQGGSLGDLRTALGDAGLKVV